LVCMIAIGAYIFLGNQKKSTEDGSLMDSDSRVLMNSQAVPNATYTPVPFSPSVGRPIRFVNLFPFELTIYYDDGSPEGVYNGNVPPGRSESTTSYLGHSFFFTPHGRKGQKVAQVTVGNSAVDGLVFYLEPKDGGNSEMMTPELERERQFSEEYFQKTGRHWLGYYPRPPLKHYMWPAEFESQVHKVVSSHGAGSCLECPTTQTTYELKVLRTAPRVFQINGLLSEEEADHLVALGRNKIIRSTTDGFESSTRTSSNTWLQRESSEVTRRLFRRAGDLLKIPELGSTAGNKYGNALQLVYYGPTQQYLPHYDWSYQENSHYRYVTLLLYLNKPKEGGFTTFPYAKLDAHAGKGSGILFYNLLPDGNPDAMSLHGGMPVVDGEKWLANFWIWDPKRQLE